MDTRLVVAALTVFATIPSGFSAGGDELVPYPVGYRDWYQHHTTVNLQGHVPEGEIGIQNVYVNAAARAGLRSGHFEDGAVFVVDRFSYRDEGNGTLKQDVRKVVAVMLRDADRFRRTGGWGFQAFKSGDPNLPVVKDGGAACFSCHMPLGASNFLFSRDEQERR